MVIFGKISGDKIIPADEKSWEILKDAKNKEVKIEFKTPRNLSFHKKYFALVRTFLDMQDYYTTEKQARSIILVRAGHCETMCGEFGEIINIPASISFSNMKQEEFEKVYDDSIDACINLLREINGYEYEKKDIERKINEILHFV